MEAAEQAGGGCVLEITFASAFAGQEFTVASVGVDEYGRAFGIAEVSLPDGTYDGVVVTEQARPVDFLLESR